MRGVKKSRNGCARCRSMRVKCGEELPACSRCTRLELDCPGYTKPLRWVSGGPRQKKVGQIQDVIFQTQQTTTGSATVAEKQNPQQLRAMSHERRLQPHGPCVADIDIANEPPILNLDEEIREVFSCFDNLSVPSGDAPSAAYLPQPWRTTPAQQNNGHQPLSLPMPAAIPSKDEVVDRSRGAKGLTLSQPLNTLSWTLIEYYFKEVAGIFSSYDSPVNPFRSTVCSLWSSSLLLCRTMQSMAAACLVNEFPQLNTQGQAFRTEALEILTSEAEMDDTALLALLMLGQTASWHSPDDLGIHCFNLLTHQVGAIAGDKLDGSFTVYPRRHFFEEALVYWEMLLSFVADSDTVSRSYYREIPSEPEKPCTSQQLPHPWTGVARDAQQLLCKVGRLVHTERMRVLSRSFTSKDDIARALRATEEAQILEKRLLSLVHATEDDIADPQDPSTPVWHFCAIADVYKDIGLLQLYRVFPDLMKSGHAMNGCTGAGLSFDVPNEPDFFQTDPRTGGWSTELTETVWSLLCTQNPSNTYIDTRPIQPEDQFLGQLPSAARQSSFGSHNDCQTSLALKVVERLRAVPAESSTRVVQPFLLVATSSELFTPTPDSSNDSLSLAAIEVSRARGFVLGRLCSLLHVLPPRPIEVCIELVREVWRRLDAGERTTYWVDVMIENGWETIMG